MEIIWHGYSFFEIKGKVSQVFGDNLVRKENVSLAIDPFSEKIGLKIPKKIESDILLISHSHHDHSNKKIIGGNPFLIQDPGEYEVRGVKIRGIESFHNSSSEEEIEANIIFVLEIEGIKICHMGDFGEKELSSSQIEEIMGVDILLIPVGGNFTISGKEASKIITRVEPKIAVPMHYKIPGLNIKIDDEKVFLGAIGAGAKEKIKKLKIKKSDISKEKTEIVLFDKY